MGTLEPVAHQSGPLGQASQPDRYAKNHRGMEASSVGSGLERVRAEATFDRERERTELALFSANDGLWDWDLGADTIHYNRRWVEQLGYTWEEFD